MRCQKKGKYAMDLGEGAPDKPQGFKQTFPWAHHLQKQMRKCCFRLALLTVFLAWPALHGGYDDVSLDTSPRRLRASDSKHGANLENGHDTIPEDEEGQDRLSDDAALTGSDIYLKWKNGCNDILVSGKDVIPYKEGKICWESCGDLLAIRVLESWLGNWQGRLQKSIFVFDWPQYVWFATYIAVFYFSCLACVVFYFYFSQPGREVRPLEAFILLFAMLLGWLWGIFGFLLHTWFSMITCLTTIAALLVEHPEDVYEVSPWAAKWIAVYRLLKFPGVESLGIPALPLKVTFILTVLLVLYLFTKAIAIGVNVYQHLQSINPSGRVLLFAWAMPGAMMIAMVMWSLFVGFTLHAILALITMFHAGTHGVIWICLKSSAASAFGWMPPTAPFAMGLAYAMCAFLHGILQEFPHYENRSKWQEKIKEEIISEDYVKEHLFKPPAKFLDRVKGPLMLLSKFGVIFADISFDFAQSVLFFCRGQIFFGVCNISGLVLQMGILLVAMAQGITSRDASLIEVVLQSDSIIHFRSSWQAGMVVTAFYEKIYREAFGETYVSMVIAIVAVFTVPLAYPSDCGLFIISICLSLSSVMSGVADALEYYTAEQETERLTGFYMRQISCNNYDARKSYKQLRKMYGIELLRVAEALAPVVSVAVCIKISSAKVAMVFAIATSAILFLLPSVPTFVTIVRKMIVPCAGRGRIESEENEENDMPLLGNVGCNCIITSVMLMILIAAALTLIVIFSPLFFFLPYKNSVALPKITEFQADESVNPMRTLSNFKNFMEGKCVWVLCFLVFFAHGYMFPDQSYCEIAAFFDGILAELSHMMQTHRTETKSLIAAVQLWLMGGALLGWILMVSSSYLIRSQRLEWTRKDAKVAKLVRSGQHIAWRILEAPLAELRKYKISSCKIEDFGQRFTLDAGASSIIQALGRLVVLALYGEEDALYDPQTLFKTDPVQATLRELTRLAKSHYYSPCAMGEDLIIFANSIPKNDNHVWQIPLQLRHLLIDLGLLFHDATVMGVQSLLEDSMKNEKSQVPYVSLPSETVLRADEDDKDTGVTSGLSLEIVTVGELLKCIEDPILHVQDPESGKIKLLIMDLNDKRCVVKEKIRDLQYQIRAAAFKIMKMTPLEHAEAVFAENACKARAFLKAAMAEAQEDVQASTGQGQEGKSQAQCRMQLEACVKDLEEALAKLEVETPLKMAEMEDVSVSDMVVFHDHYGILQCVGIVEEKNVSAGYIIVKHVPGPETYGQGDEYDGHYFMPPYPISSLKGLSLDKFEETIRALWKELQEAVMKESAESLAKAKVEAAGLKVPCATREAWLLDFDDFASAKKSKKDFEDVNVGDLVILESLGDSTVGIISEKADHGPHGSKYKKVWVIDAYDEQTELFSGYQPHPLVYLERSYLETVSPDTQVQVLSPMKTCFRVCAIMQDFPSLLKETSEASDADLDKILGVDNWYIPKAE